MKALDYHLKQSLKKLHSKICPQCGKEYFLQTAICTPCFFGEEQEEEYDGGEATQFMNGMFRYNLLRKSGRVDAT